MWIALAIAAPAALTGAPSDEALRLPLPDVPLVAPIVGGEPAPADAWPDVVAIYTRNETFGCTGTLIAPDLVITAGHCGFGMASVLVGTQDLSAGGRQIPIAETWVHPDYFSTFDVAVYRLAEPVLDVPPRRLLLDCDAEEALFEDAEVTIVGFGDIDVYGAVSTDVLHQATAIVRDPVCRDPANACNPDVSPGGELIAGGDGVDTCNGDSGGPLFVTTAAGTFLAGVTSRAALPKTLPCGDGGIYARTDAVAAWVEAETGLAMDWPTDCPDINHPPYPTAEPMEVLQGGIVGRSTILVNDPDDDQTHTFRIATAPAVGQAWMDGDRLVFRPPQRSSDDAVVTIEVTDDGDPPQSAQVDVPITVLAVTVVTPPQSSGCRTVPSPTWWWAQLAMALGFTRSRSRARASGKRTRSGSCSP